MKRYIQTLLKVNMERPYGTEWPVEEKVKRREMVAPEARYMFVRETSATGPSSNSSRTEGELSDHLWLDDGDRVVGFVQYRFIVEEDIPVVYVYELQLESCVQGKGLGKFLMQLIELIAHKNHMGAVMLTVQKANELAMNFYTNTLRYVISTISPSRVDPLLGAEKNYEILCKTFDNEAKVKLEDNCIRLE
uniref:N-alpha-acetyltransferase 40 n=1 Tax=Anthurium amnicola TaxID=1678845 RepID=A0A1D1Z1M6_9ARAE